MASFITSIIDVVDDGIEAVQSGVAWLDKCAELKRQQEEDRARIAKCESGLEELISERKSLENKFDKLQCSGSQVTAEQDRLRGDLLKIASEFENLKNEFAESERLIDELKKRKVSYGV